MSRKLTRRRHFRNQVWCRANRLYWTLREQGMRPEEALRRHDRYLAEWNIPLVPAAAERLEAERICIAAERESREAMRPRARESARRALRAAEDSYIAARLQAWRGKLSQNQIA